MRYFRFIVVCLMIAQIFAQTPQQPRPAPTVYLLKPFQVFDGESGQLRAGWVVLVRGDKIESAGPGASISAPSDAKVIDLPGTTLMPGLIEAHSHVLLHPYNETSWNDQNAHESL